MNFLSKTYHRKLKTHKFPLMYSFKNLNRVVQYFLKNHCKYENGSIPTALVVTSLPAL